MAPPKRYEAIDFTPPQGVRDAAKRGLEQRRKYGRGGLTTAEAGKQGIGSGVARAATLAAGQAITPETAKRMKAFFARHGNAPQAKPADGGPSARQIAINLWGGRAGEAWARKLVRQMEAADEKMQKGLAPAGTPVRAQPLTFGEALAKAKLPKLPLKGGGTRPGAKPAVGGRPGGTFQEAKHPRAKDGKFARKGATVATYAKDQPLPKALNGVPFKPWDDAPTTQLGWATVKGQNPKIAEPPLPALPEGMKLGSGVIIREPDGRVWLTKPTNEFGGYKHTFPKGTAEEGLSLQANAIKEAFEETGLQVEIVGYAGDVKRTTSVGRYYYARRVGGSPAAHGWESEAVVLVPPAKLHSYLNMPLDQRMAHDLAGAPKPPPPPPPPPKPKASDPDGFDELFSVKAPATGGWAGKKPVTPYTMAGEKEAAAAAWKKKWGSMWNVKKGQEGAPIEGVRGFWDIYVPASEPIPFRAMLEAVTKALPKMPKLPKGAKGAKGVKGGNYGAGAGETIVGNLCRGPSGHFVACGVGGQALHNVNPKKWPTATNNAAANAAKHIAAYEAAHKAGDLAGLLAIKPNMDALLPGKGNPYTKGKALVWKAAHDDLMAQKAGAAVVEAAAKPLPTKGWTKTGGQLGSNPGGKFMDADGVQHYVKFSKSATHAQNEALASQLYALADSPAVPVTLVDDIPLGGKGLGTATKWTTKSDFNLSNPAHKALAHQDFATHAWLSNWDAVGMSYDNLAMVDGKMTVMDTGGSLLFRAQGEPKGDLFGDVVAEWDTLRSAKVNAQSAKVFGDMDATAMFNSAKKVANIPDDAITKVVLAHGPGSLADRQAMAARLIARKKDIIAKANALGMGNVLDDGAKILPQPAAVATPKAPEPPKPAGKDISPKEANPAGALSDDEAKAALQSAAPSWNSSAKPMAGTPAAMLLQAAKTGDIPAIESVSLGGALGVKAKKAMIDAIEAKAAKAGSAAVAGGVAAGAVATAAGKKVVLSADEVMAAATKAAPSKAASGDWTKTQAKDLDGIKAAAAQGIDEVEAFVPDSLVGAGTKAEVLAAMKGKASGVGAGAAAGVAAAGAAAAAAGAAKLSVKEAGDLLIAEMPAWNVATSNGVSGVNALWQNPTWAKVKAGIEAGDIAAVKAAGATFSDTPGGAVAAAAHKKLVAAMEGGAGAAVVDAATAPAAMASQAIKTPPALPKPLTVADLTTPANKPSKAMADTLGGIQKVADDYASGAINGPEALTKLNALSIGGTNTYWKKIEKQKAAVMSAISQHAGADLAAAAAASAAKATAPKAAVAAVAGGAAAAAVGAGAAKVALSAGEISAALPFVSGNPVALAQGDSITGKAMKLAMDGDLDGLKALDTKQMGGAAANKQKLIEALEAKAQGAPSLAGGATTADTLIQPPPPLVKQPPIGGGAQAFDASKLTAPPDFMNWNGPGKPGPSTVLALNEANKKATQEIWALAQKGDIDGIKKLQLDVVDKATGKVTGKAPFDQHPSQHVKGFGAQAIAEIDAIKNPPPKVSFGDVPDLRSVDKAFPAIAVSDMPKAAKTAKYAKLGSVPLEKVDAMYASLTAPAIKKTYKGGELTTATYNQQATASWNKMSKTAKSAIKSHTGGGFTASNADLWGGNESASVAAARSAVVSHGHYVEPGTVLSRKINVSGQALEDLKNSAGQILFEAAQSSTSINPDIWSGNLQWKITVGPGVKGLWVSGATGISNVGPQEMEMFIPSGARMLVRRVYKSNGKDADGFGPSGVEWIGEAILLPNDSL